MLSATALMVLALTLLSLMVGKYPITPTLLLNGDKQAIRVFLTLRVPRTCMALLGGFGLGIAGNVFQTVFHNPLASPDIIGVSSGASAGAAFGILFFGFSALPITLSAFLGGLLAVMLTLALGSISGNRFASQRALSGNSNASIVLAGIAVHSLAQTLLMALKLLADPEKELASIEYWLMGSLSGISIHRLPISFAIALTSILGICMLHRQILLLSLEESESRMLGVSVGKLRFAVLLLATLLTASVISNTGLISFIGLLAPHTARLLTGSSRFPTLLLGGLWGSLLLLAADILARSVASSELPVSIFTSLLGAPFLIYLVIKAADR